MFTIFAGLAEFERDMISERTKAGLESVRARGRNGGRSRKDEDKVKLVLKMYNSKQYSITEITKATGNKTALYKYIKEHSNNPTHFDKFSTDAVLYSKQTLLKVHLCKSPILLWWLFDMRP